MIYTTEEFENIYGKLQYRTLYKGDEFEQAQNVMFLADIKDNTTKIEIFGNDGELLAVKKIK